MHRVNGRLTVINFTIRIVISDQTLTQSDLSQPRQISKGELLAVNLKLDKYRVVFTLQQLVDFGFL